MVGLSALTLMPIRTQAVAESPASRISSVGLGWYSVAPSALGLVEESATHLDHCHFYCRLAPMGREAWPMSGGW